MRKYLCDNCGKEFDSLTAWKEDEFGYTVGDFPHENLWKIYIGCASDKKPYPVAFKEVCTECREKLEKFIKEGF